MEASYKQHSMRNVGPKVFSLWPRGVYCRSALNAGVTPHTGHRRFITVETKDWEFAFMNQTLFPFAIFRESVSRGGQRRTGPNTRRMNDFTSDICNET